MVERGYVYRIAQRMIDSTVGRYVIICESRGVTLSLFGRPRPSPYWSGPPGADPRGGRWGGRTPLGRGSIIQGRSQDS